MPLEQAQKLMARNAVRVNKHRNKLQTVVYCLVEGDTEKNYLQQLKKMLNLNIKIDVITKPKLQANIRADINKLKSQHNISDDELFLIYDLENNSEEKNKFLEYTNGTYKKKFKNTYLTQSCFEVFLLLHFENCSLRANQYKSAANHLTSLQCKLPNYCKGYKGFDAFITEESLHFLTVNSSLINDLNQNTFSDVHEFINLLKKMSLSQ